MFNALNVNVESNSVNSVKFYIAFTGRSINQPTLNHDQILMKNLLRSWISYTLTFDIKTYPQTGYHAAFLMNIKKIR